MLIRWVFDNRVGLGLGGSVLMEYFIIHSKEETDKLEMKVEELSKKGWKIHGDLCVIVREGHIHLYQAMVLNDNVGVREVGVKEFRYGDVPEAKEYLPLRLTGVDTLADILKKGNKKLNESGSPTQKILEKVEKKRIDKLINDIDKVTDGEV